MAIDREVIVERTPGTRLEGMRVSWGGIFGGVLILSGLFFARPRRAGLSRS